MSTSIPRLRPSATASAIPALTTTPPIDDDNLRSVRQIVHHADDLPTQAQSP
jgi:hypothetical protein